MSDSGEREVWLHFLSLQRQSLLCHVCVFVYILLIVALSRRGLALTNRDDAEPSQGGKKDCVQVTNFTQKSFSHWTHQCYSLVSCGPQSISITTWWLEAVQVINPTSSMLADGANIVWWCYKWSKVWTSSCASLSKCSWHFSVGAHGRHVVSNRNQAEWTQCCWVYGTNLGLVELSLSLSLCLSSHGLLILLQGHIGVWWTAGVGVGRTLRRHKQQHFSKKNLIRVDLDSHFQISRCYPLRKHTLSQRHGRQLVRFPSLFKETSNLWGLALYKCVSTPTQTEVSELWSSKRSPLISWNDEHESRAQ